MLYLLHHQDQDRLGRIQMMPEITQENNQGNKKKGTCVAFYLTEGHCVKLGLEKNKKN